MSQPSPTSTPSAEPGTPTPTAPPAGIPRPRPAGNGQATPPAEAPPPTPAPGSPAAGPARPVRRAARLVAAARLAAPAVGGYLAVRLVGMALLWWWGSTQDRGLLALLRQSDAVWYVRLARNGYDAQLPVGPDGAPAPSNLAFFPLFPALMRLGSEVLPVSPGNAGLLVSWLAGLAAAWGIFAVGNRLAGRRLGTLLAVLWGVLPHAVVQSMAYTETLFTALAAWSLYAVLTRRWIVAAALCVLAGLTRPTALALIAAVGVAAVHALWRRQDRWRPLVALAVAPLGWLGYVGWVGLRLGRVDGWFEAQRHWHSTFDGGGYTLATALDVLAGRDASVVMLVVTLVLAVSVALLLAARGQPLPVLVYSAAALVVTLGGGGGYYHAKARFLVPAFTLLLPLAAGLARMRPRTLAVTLGLAALASAWFGGYLSLVWEYSP